MLFDNIQNSLWNLGWKEVFKINYCDFDICEVILLGTLTSNCPWFSIGNMQMYKEYLFA